MAPSPSLPILRLGSRGSKLARAQAEELQRALAERCGLDSELVVVTTTGDRIQDRPLADLGGKGLFTKELEAALLANEIDLAVHSMKDVPTLLPDGLVIAAILERGDPRDAFIGRDAPTLEDLPAGARIGTSSVRRAAQIGRARPDLQVVPLRGNVDTRLRKLDLGEIDAILLALAGLRRIGRAERATQVLDPEQWLPALSQGAVGIEMRQDHPATAQIAVLRHEATEIVLACERAFQAELDGSCRTPIAGLARYDQGRLSFAGEVLAPDGSDFAAARFEKQLGQNALDEAREEGRAAAAVLKDRVRGWLA